MSAAQWLRDLDQAGGRALVLKARATGKLGDSTAAAKLAKQSFDLYPTAEAAREHGKWLAATGDLQDAIDRYADAFTIEDPRNNEQDRSKDRSRLGELYMKATGSERGLGDRILASYDRMSAVMTARLAQLKSKDPNVEAGSILDFTLPSPNGNPLPLTSLKGKTIVFDFWATWCIPCKAQRPLYEDVERKFSADKDVVFVSVNTDEDRAQVAPFLKQQNWKNAVYYDAGLADFVKVTSIPTTLIVDRSGQIASRMNGFIPERFVDLLTQRVEETRR
jgi:thiol-disulfide isomerase/thioredoxin